MQYARMLNKILAEKGYKDANIIRMCKEIGENIDKGSFSKYINGISIPSEKRSRAIAKVCGIDERILIISGYLDKAPKEILDTFKTIRLMQETGAMKFLKIQDKIKLKDAEKIIEEDTLSDTIIDILDSKEKFIDFLNKGFIYKKINSSFNYSVALIEPQGIEIKDDAMSPIIQKGDKVTIDTKQNTYTTSDIVLVEYKDKIYARYMYKVNDTLILSPINKAYKQMHDNKDKIKVLGKINNVIRKI
ncbi:MAG: hypothetical protein IJE59_00765 [Clostridia bacterium]|nr:hypothetical protein [Clostridia bacterium]